MVKRKLSKEEQLLWQYYTKNIEKTMTDQREELTPVKAVAVKNIAPKRTIVKKTPTSISNGFENLKNKDSNWTKKLKQGKAPIEGKIDLHGMTCAEAYGKLLHFLEGAQKKSKRVVLIVTGKGRANFDDPSLSFSGYKSTIGVLRREVPMWLSGSAMRHMIVSFQDASISHGGSGALYVILKRS